MTGELGFLLFEDDPEAFVMQVLTLSEVGAMESWVLDVGSIAWDDSGTGSELRALDSPDSMLYSNPLQE